MLTLPAVLERHQNHVRRHRRTSERLVANRRSNRIHHRAVRCTNWWFADTAYADWRLGVRQVDRIEVEHRRRIEDRRWLVVVEPLGQRHAVMLVVDPFLRDRVA